MSYSLLFHACRFTNTVVMFPAVPLAAMMENFTGFDSFSHAALYGTEEDGSIIHLYSYQDEGILGEIGMN